MSRFEEQFFLGIFSFFSSVSLWLGAYMTDGDTRWLYITFASSVTTAACLSLYFKKEKETIKIIIGRSGISIMGGIFGTKIATPYFESVDFHSDGVALAGIASGVCCLSFIVGVGVINAISKKADEIAKKIVEKYTKDLE